MVLDKTPEQTGGFSKDVAVDLDAPEDLVWLRERALQDAEVTNEKGRHRVIPCPRVASELVAHVLKQKERNWQDGPIPLSMTPRQAQYFCKSRSALLYCLMTTRALDRTCLEAVLAFLVIAEEAAFLLVDRTDLLTFKL